MNVCVIGTGYVGLVTGTVFADLGNEVICVDNVKKKIDMLNSGVMPIYEPGLREMVLRNVEEKRLSFTTKISDGIRKSKVIFIAVGTPPKANGESDLTAVEEVAREIARYMDDYKIIVNKSTVPVGTGNFVRNIIEKFKRNNCDFDVVSNPEFLKEGSAIADCLYPDRIVIGVPNHHVAMALLELYAPLERPMLITDVESAEIIKYASNAFLATKISFINFIANICEKAGADVTLVAKGMGYDSRIGSHFLQAGLGFGGSCFPKDTLSLLCTAKKFKEDASILESVIKLNENRVPRFANRIMEKLKPMKGKVIGILGLAFKPNTDDLRDAKSLVLIRDLLKKKASIKVFDPVAMDNAKNILKNVTFCKNAYDVAKGADALVVVTEWNEFKLLNLDKLRQNMRGSYLFDGRNIYARERVERAGFKYICIGMR
ncbi:UDP-glucose/GDP-mannose dehydrogenase family protein [Candidatus Sumerlaeota bacterium]|nr:UDP-glucose/GDP-mannose dehydrogenase family protein [Candidatus Sumerlaeota bacterium]